MSENKSLDRAVMAITGHLKLIPAEKPQEPVNDGEKWVNAERDLKSIQPPTQPR